MKEIPLVNSDLVALVDDQDYEDLIRYSWYPLINKRITYARRNAGRGKQVLMHRDILAVTDSSVWIDHEDYNGLHNWRSNLRPAAPVFNSANTRRRVSKAGFIGVYQTGKDSWCSRIRINGKKTHLGAYRTVVEAAYAYDRKAKELYGEFARLNFPEDREFQNAA